MLYFYNAWCFLSLLHDVSAGPTQDAARRPLVHVARALAVAVNEVDGEDACAQDAEAHEQGHAGVHAHVDTLVNVDTLLSIC